MFLPLLLLLACGPPTLERGARPDIVILTVDTLRPDRLGAYGAVGASTPNIDRLAQRGVVFTNATTPLPRTTPALASMLTGVLPHRHGSREVGQPVTLAPSVASAFAEQGYTTVAVSGTPVAGPDQKLDAGFQHFGVHFDLPAPALAARALAHTDTDRPLLLWVHFVDPHFPYLPPGASDGPCRELGQRAADNKLARVDLFIDRDGIASEALAHCRDLYDAEVSTADAGIGAVLDGLAAQGREPGLVLVSADHGEHFGEEGIFYEHGPSVHDAALRIPLIAAGEGVVPHTDAGVARLEDIAPTLLAAAGLVAWPGLDGADLSARLAGAAPPEDAIALAESGDALHARFTLSLRSGRPERRLCLNDPPWSLCQRPGQPARLFNHQTDPTLQTDLAASNPQVVAALTAAAARWPQTARQRTARTATVKQTALPQLAGGYQHTAQALPGGAPVAAQERLTEAMGQLPAQQEAGVEAPVEDALRALGYIE